MHRHDAHLPCLHGFPEFIAARDPVFIVHHVDGNGANARQVQSLHERRCGVGRALHETLQMCRIDNFCADSAAFE